MDKIVSEYLNFPLPGVRYFDFSTLLQDPDRFHESLLKIYNWTQGLPEKVNYIAAIEAKGFLIASPLSLMMKAPLYLIRKPNLIPGEVIEESFKKEYGEGKYQMRTNSIEKLPLNASFLLIYDILATAGASLAASKLIERNGGKVVAAAYAVELEYLNARAEFLRHDVHFSVFSLLKISH